MVTHGDVSLGNVLLDAGGRVTGCIDVGRLGAANPYQDLAIPWESLGEFGPEAQQAPWPAYSFVTPDERRLRFHLLLGTLPDTIA